MYFELLFFLLFALLYNGFCNAQLSFRRLASQTCIKIVGTLPSCVDLLLHLLLPLSLTDSFLKSAHGQTIQLCCISHWIFAEKPIPIKD